MIETFRKIWRFAGDERKQINRSVAVSLLNAVLQMFQIGAIYLVVRALTGGAQGGKTAWLALILELVSIFGGAVTASISKMYQTHAGYFMAANRRIAIADRMKRIPMGFFNDNSLGQLSGVCTTVIGSIETMVPIVMVNILSGLISTLVFTAVILIFDWRIGLIAAAGILAYLGVVSAMEKRSAAIADGTQRAQTALIEAVLEHIQSMSVVKSFNLTGKGDGKLQNALEASRESSLEVEQVMTPFTAAQEAVLQIASVGMMLAAVLLRAGGSMTLPDALMVILVSFLVFSQVKLFGMGVSMQHLAGAAIDRTEQTEQMPQMDEAGKAVSPAKHDISFEHVSFSYEQRQILHDISVTLPDRTTTAIVGPSGSGKTTFCNLIARFWDVDSGCVRIGGTDVRAYTLESLMSQISMVFQNVYLFADTIENNIRFGCPNATHAQVVEAAKRACCDTFIEALTHEKTVIMIAHRLKTVRRADQILVLSDGKIVQQGRHEDLIRQPGLYADFIGSKQQAAGWKL